MRGKPPTGGATIRCKSSLFRPPFPPPGATYPQPSYNVHNQQQNLTHYSDAAPGWPATQLNFQFTEPNDHLLGAPPGLLLSSQDSASKVPRPDYSQYHSPLPAERPEQRDALIEQKQKKAAAPKKKRMTKDELEVENKRKKAGKEKEKAADKLVKDAEKAADKARKDAE
ncbi:hypothetical protein FRC12_024842 [Ceratobasidium sp. 428]|nr:hypothetical protein FRC12_024842 [Ceratobasidium sp. 428]